MKNKDLFKSLLIVFVVIVVGLFLVGQFSSDFKIKNTKYVKIAGQSVRVDLAVTDKERTQGLSGRSGLTENEGMLFVFEKLGQYSFWMKGMNFPIDIIWLGEDMNVIYIKKDAKPEDFLETYGPDDVPTESRGSSIAKAVGTKYVLEVMSGFSDKNNLKIGDKVEFVN